MNLSDKERKFSRELNRAGIYKGEHSAYPYLMNLHENVYRYSLDELRSAIREVYLICPITNKTGHFLTEFNVIL